MAARTDRPIGHHDTLPQFRTDETAIPKRDLNARGVWFVGWSKTVGSGVLWWSDCGFESGYVAAVGDWETGEADKWGHSDAGVDGRDAS
jgi:hypothetical protein